MPSYTETFPCPVCCGTTTTTTIGPTTTQQPGVCPEGYEPCGSSGGTWIVDTDCEWAFVNNDGCPEGCESFWITWPIVGVDDCFSTPPGTFGTGVCCRPITSTTSTTQGPCNTSSCLYMCDCVGFECSWMLLSDNCNEGCSCVDPFTASGFICDISNSGNIDQPNCQ